MRPRRGRTSSGEQAVEPALRALDGGIDRFDGGVERAGAGRALFGRGALHEGQLARALAAHAAAQSGLRVDPDQLDAVRLGERERLRSERGHHLAPDRHGGARPGQARRAVVVVADPHYAEPVARESGKPGVAPSRAEANGCTSRSTPSRRTLASTRSTPSSVPRRAVATL